MIRRLHVLPFLALLVPAAAGCAVPSADEQSVKPGINDPFLAEDLDTSQWVERFEGEGREVYREQDLLLEALALEPGEDVADVGSGTGFFTLRFAEAVGPEGRVYAVDIAPAFLDLAMDRAAAAGLEDRVVPVLAGEKSCNLPPESVDAAFLCDTYHHIEYPRHYLASLHTALRPGGRLMLVEFHRPAEDDDAPRSAWLRDHVRADQATFVREFEDAGFRLEREVPGLEDNYVLVFRRD